jgi:MoaA/NifB/PqqE/SkfB family radical SAM enzyme
MGMDKQLPMTPKAFHIMVKPTGAACNLHCDYCFFLKKERLYPASTFRMSDEVHEAYIRQLFEAHEVQKVSWEVAAINKSAIIDQQRLQGGGRRFCRRSNVDQ